jgi:hypothetical protein
MRSMKHRAWLLFALATALAGAATASAQVTDQDVPLAGATSVRLNVSGHVHVVFDDTAAGGNVRLHVINNGPSSPPMHVSTSRVGGRLTVTITGPSSSLLPFVGPTGYEVHVTIPAAIPLDLREFDGHVQIDRITAPTQIYNAVGAIDVVEADALLTAEADAGNIHVGSANNTLNLTDANGSITASLANGWHGKQVRLETSNGDIMLAVPPDLHGSFDVTSADGTVKNPMKSTSHAPSIFLLAEKGNVTIAIASPSP